MKNSSTEIQESPDAPGQQETKTLSPSQGCAQLQIFGKDQNVLAFKGRCVTLFTSLTCFFSVFTIEENQMHTSQIFKHFSDSNRPCLSLRILTSPGRYTVNPGFYSECTPRVSPLAAAVKNTSAAPSLSDTGSDYWLLIMVTHSHEAMCSP